jgi:hypothetical protein
MTLIDIIVNAVTVVLVMNDVDLHRIYERPKFVVLVRVVVHGLGVHGPGIHGPFNGASVSWCGLIIAMVFCVDDYRCGIHGPFNGAGFSWCGLIIAMVFCVDDYRCAACAHATNV